MVYLDLIRSVGQQARYIFEPAGSLMDGSVATRSIKRRRSKMLVPSKSWKSAHCGLNCVVQCISLGYSTVWVPFAPLSDHHLCSLLRRDVTIPIPTRRHLRCKLSIKPSRIGQALSDMEYDIVDILSSLA